MTLEHLILLRHGETDWNRNQRLQGHRDIALNAAGHHQALDAAPSIVALRPSVIVSSDLRRARSATHSMIPTKTGAAAAVGLVLPELNGKLDGFAIRVPTINVSLVDLSFNAGRKTTVEEVHSIVKAAADGPLKGILAYNDQPLVSVDFNHDPASSTYDATLTKVMAGTLVKVCAWYDNEWGFSNRMLDTTLAWSKAV